MAPWSDNPNAPDPNGWTPIQSAAEKGYFEIIRILTPLSGNPNAPDPDGWTPIQRLHNHATKNRIEGFDQLIELIKSTKASDLCLFFN